MSADENEVYAAAGVGGEGVTRWCWGEEGGSGREKSDRSRTSSFTSANRSRSPASCRSTAAWLSASLR